MGAGASAEGEEPVHGPETQLLPAPREPHTHARHESEEEVSVEAVVAVVRKNAALAREVIVKVARALPRTTEELPYPRSLTHAIMTDPAKITPEVRARVDLIAGHLLG